MTVNDKIFVITSYFCGDDETCRYFTHDLDEAKSKLQEMILAEDDGTFGVKEKFVLTEYLMNTQLPNIESGQTIALG